jgi:sugar/nucleoside kinase (ribokinase family)
MANIIVVGEVLFDRISEKGVANSYEMFLGGAPANCAMGISFFEKHTVFFVGGVGTDDFGRRALHTLKNNGVRTEYVTRTDYPTRIVTVKRDPIGNNRVFGGFQEGNKEIYADEDIHPIILQHAFFEREYTLLYTGSLIMAGRKSLDAVREMLALAQEKNIPIFLDVNMRPAFFSEDTSAMIVAIETFLSVASIVKMSSHFLQESFLE